MKTTYCFMLVDDDPFCNSLSGFAIKRTCPGADIACFTDPQEGLAHIASSYDTKTDRPTILLLDLNMPVMSGWEFIDKYGELEDGIRKQFRIYILTSSVSSHDSERALANPYIRDYLVKPFTDIAVQKILSDQS